MRVEINNQPYNLGEVLASGGEGKVYSIVGLPDQVCKIYETKPDRNKILKLTYLIEHTPPDPNSKHSHISWAFPTSLVSYRRSVVGFTMPKITQGRQLIEVYNPKIRQKKGLELNWQFLITVAYNICTIVEALHKHGYVIGDMKPQNILINSRALPTLIDIDSIQAGDYKCSVGSVETTPPELIGKDLTYIHQLPEQDSFRLSILIYLTLFGEHPFKDLANPSAGIAELINRGIWLGNQDTSNSRCLDINLVPAYIKSLFHRCFNAGLHLLENRPTATEWKESLLRLRKEVISCSDYDTDTYNPHYYHPEYGECYWCARKRRLNFDIFGSVALTKEPKPIVLKAHEPDVFWNYQWQHVYIMGVIKDISILNQRKRIVRLVFEDLRLSSVSQMRAFEINIDYNTWLRLPDQTQQRILDLKGKRVKAFGTIYLVKAISRTVPLFRYYDADFNKFPFEVF